jgi:phosphoribosylaminoimidazolecarboxamide formyltransferase / IMP cyclohydrolase
MKTALVSVSNKNGLIPFVRGLVKHGYRIVSTGGTASHLKENGFNVIPIDEVTGFPEILDGRVKTLHPKLFGGILADSTKKEHLEELGRHAINRIDMVVVNLYPFVELYEKDSSDTQEMIEHIDIGGVTLLRAAAKNHLSVTVVSDIDDYSLVIAELDSDNEVSGQTRCNFAYKAFAQTAEYDQWIASFMRREVGNDDNLKLTFPGKEKRVLRYGENPHQAAFLVQPQGSNLIKQLHGKQLSYNNYLDTNAALKLIGKFSEPTIAILKHTNPCGVATASDLTAAYKRCLQTDVLSPFGGIVTANGTVNMELAQAIDKIFTEIIIAPDYEQSALDFLMKKKARRLIRFDSTELNKLSGREVYVSCLDGILVQDADIGFDDESNWKFVTKREPDNDESAALKFGWKVVSALKSNAICINRRTHTIGLGVGQTSRIDSTEIAISRAAKFNHDTNGSVCASDGFFPFRDSIDYLAAKGIKAVIQPGGSKGDAEVIAACNEHGITMIFTGLRHFVH